GSITKLTLLALALIGLAIPGAAKASADLDRQYALEKLGYLRSWDNVDNLFADYVSNAYRDYFSHQSRFIVQDLSKADAILTNSKIPYNKVIDDADVLGQLARATRAESILRTKILKEGHRYRFTIDWLHSPMMEVMAREEFTMDEPTDGKAFGLGDINDLLQKALDRLFAKVPFSAQVTGRDNNSVTVNEGQGADLKPGDTLLVSTLDEVKKHPLLHTIVGWTLTPVGKLTVDTVDEGIAFCKVTEEQPGRSISRYMKITQVIPVAAPPTDGTNGQIIDETKAAQTDKAALEPPKLGFVELSTLFGGSARSYSNSAIITPGANFNGGGFMFQGKADGEIWFNRDWFADLGFIYGIGNYNQTDTVSNTPSPATAAGGVNESLFSFKVNAGYSFLVTGDFFGPKAWLKAGYQLDNWYLPNSTIENTNSISYSAIFLGVGGDVPIRAGFGAQLNFEYAVFTFSSQTALASGSASAAHHVTLYAGGYYRFTPRITFKAGFDLLSDGTEYPAGVSNHQQVLSALLGAVYYF
ncbi:MAG: hypothetical protein ACXWP5_12055, partial [Bdellovibrionota bacterium]